MTSRVYMEFEVEADGELILSPFEGTETLTMSIATYLLPLQSPKLWSRKNF